MKFEDYLPPPPHFDWVEEMEREEREEREAQARARGCAIAAGASQK